MKELLEAGVHFGHQTRRWNPKMKRYIYAGRNGIYIIDLHQTVKLLEDAFEFVRGVAAKGGSVLFVGTKKQAQDSVRESAERCGMHYVTERWLGGMLTNFRTIRLRIDRLVELRRMEEGGDMNRLPKKERLRLGEQRRKLERVLSGIENMPGPPQVVFIIDTRKEHIAVAEARRLKIPVVAIVDTNCDPNEVDYVIPGNDDAIRAIKLISSKMADAVDSGRQELEAKQAREAALAETVEEGEEAAEPALVAADLAEIEAAMLAEEGEVTTDSDASPAEAPQVAAEEPTPAPAEETPAPPERQDEPEEGVELT
jgi:small subunit ribosomal protein S2